MVPLLPFLSPAIILHKVLIWAICSFDSYVKNLVMNTYIELLISWLQSPSAMILDSQKINSVTVSTVSPSICHEVMGPGAMILVF